MTRSPRALQGLSTGVRSTTFALESVILERTSQCVAILLVNQLTLAALDAVLPHTCIDCVNGVVRNLPVSVRFAKMPLAAVSELVFALDLAEALHQAIFELALENSS